MTYSGPNLQLVKMLRGIITGPYASTETRLEAVRTYQALRDYERTGEHWTWRPVG